MPNQAMRVAAYLVVGCSLFALLILLFVGAAWGAPPVPNVPVLQEDSGTCPDGTTTVTLRVYDTNPSGEDFYAQWTTGGKPFLVIVLDKGVRTAYVQLPGREEKVLTYEQLTERYESPCDIAALVVGAPI